jgi:hypothetical protein
MFSSSSEKENPDHLHLRSRKTPDVVVWALLLDKG